MSIAQNYPIIAPSMSMDFAAVQALDSRVTFARATTATYYGTRTAKAEENLLLQSQTFDGGGAPWSSSNVTVTPNSVAAPDGTTTAETLSENTANSNHHIGQVSTLNTNTTYTVSVFVKANTLNYAGITLRGANANYAAAEFNLSTGAISRTSALGTGYSVTSTSITSAGSGWYRCSAVVVAGASVAAPRFYVFLSDGSAVFDADGMPSYIGASNSVYLWGAQLEQRSTVTAYTPTTTQPVTNYIPVLETAASGVARFDHSPTTFESLGLLIEEQRTNLFTYSEQFADAAWTKVNATITANTVVAPDGTLTGDLLIESTATGAHGANQSFNFTSGTTYTISVYAKQGIGVRNLRFSSGNAGIINFVAVFNISNGTVVSGTGATITPVGNGWYRCSFSATAASTGSTSANPCQLADGTTASYTGDGYSGIYIWGAQLEAGAFATSYIPTVASQVTRAADAASMTGANFSSWYTQGEGTIYIEAAANSSTTSMTALTISDNTSSNRILLGTGVNNTIWNPFIITGGVGQATLSQSASYPPQTSQKLAVAYKVNDFAATTSGINPTTDNSGILPVVDRVYIGAGATGVAVLNSTIKRFSFYPLRLTDTNLQALTG